MSRVTNFGGSGSRGTDWNSPPASATAQAERTTSANVAVMNPSAFYLFVSLSQWTRRFRGSRTPHRQAVSAAFLFPPIRRCAAWIPEQQAARQSTRSVAEAAASQHNYV